MTAIAQQEDAASQPSRRYSIRTLAMSLVSVGNATIGVSLAYFLLAVVAPLGDRPFTGALIALMSIFIGLVGITAIVSAVWGGARRRAWFWLAATVPALLLLLENYRHIASDIIHPAATGPYLVTITFLAGAVAALVGGVAAFLDVRRGRPTWTRTGRAAWTTAIVAGVLVGAAATSILAGAAASAGSASSAGVGDVAAPPTTTGTLIVANFKFADSSIEMKSGDVLGLLITNNDETAHSFDIDSLDLHVPLPPNATTAVAVQPTGPGTIEFYCALPGHKGAGMVGTISIE
jgi:uncharacterized cupredoxin-like copper-binding protein